MNRRAYFLVVLSMLVFGQVFKSADVQASSVPISESSYVQITNFSGWYEYMNIEDPNGPPVLYEWNGFDAFYASYYRSIPTIEAKVINFMHPDSPPANGWSGSGAEQNGLLFDCHSGSANLGDYASAAPVIFCGMEPWTHVEFDWTSNINALVARYLWLEVAGYPNLTLEQHVQWRMQLRTGLRTGHAVIDLPNGSILDAVNLRLAVEPVPEPGSLAAFGVGLSILVLRKRRKII